MGRLFTAASSEHLSVVSPVLTVKPLSMACWYKPVSLTQQAMLVVLQSNSTANRQFAVALAATTGLVQASERGSAGVVATSASGLSVGAWGHCAVTFATSTTGNRLAYLNGAPGSGVTSAVATAPVPERTDIGAYYPASVGTFGSFTDGVVAMPAIWNVVLTAGEINALARGVSPFSIRPGNLKFYAPLFGAGSSEPDFTAGQRALTATGTVVAAHPPSAPLLFGLSTPTLAVAGGGGGGGGMGSSLTLLGVG